MKSKAVFIISILLIILFCYAAIIKIYDVDKFRSQMMQSPMLPANLIVFFSYAIPAVELLAISLLIFEQTRLQGMYLSYAIMFTFSLYLTMLVSLYDGNIPCACGGILGQMGYATHIVFNVFFTVMPLISIFILEKESNKQVAVV